MTRRTEFDSDVPQNGMVNHLFQLRPDLSVILVLPADLTVAESERVAGFVTALAFAEETPVIESSAPDVVSRMRI